MTGTLKEDLLKLNNIDCTYVRVECPATAGNSTSAGLHLLEWSTKISLIQFGGRSNLPFYSFSGFSLTIDTRN